MITLAWPLFAALLCSAGLWGAIFALIWALRYLRELDREWERVERLVEERLR